MFTLNDKPLAADTAFQHDGISYPANWLRLATAAERKEIGITEVAEQTRPDDRYYWVSQNADGTFASTPKELSDLKSVAIGQIKTAAGALLAATDWMVTRAAEGVKPVNSVTLLHRTAIRSKSNNFESAISACVTVDELAALAFDWQS